MWGIFGNSNFQDFLKRYKDVDGFLREKKKALRLRIDLILISIVAREREKKFCWLTGGKGCVQRKTVNNYLTFMQVNLITLEVPSEITKNEKMTLPVGRFFISN